MLSTVQTAPSTYRQPAGDVVAALATEARRGLSEERRGPGCNATGGTS
jgi:hypothetical protein